MNRPEEAARRLLDSISESLSVDPDRLARVAGQFITPNGSQVYPVRLNGRTAYVTVPED
jgi:hypothetical protein